MSRQRQILALLSIAIMSSAGCASTDERRASEAPVSTGTSTAAAWAPVRQHIATVASVDQRTQTVRLTHGPTVRVTPATQMRLGKDGPALTLTDLRPGDKLIFTVAAADTASTAGSQTMRRAASTGTDASGSALPREASGLATPGQVLEVKVFRPAR